jgi:hypothetical protein
VSGFFEVLRPEELQVHEVVLLCEHLRDALKALNDCYDKGIGSEVTELLHLDLQVLQRHYKDVICLFHLISNLDIYYY